jgi:putative ABC transport system substrate-binding protein
MKRQKSSQHIDNSALIAQHAVLCLTLCALLFALCFPVEAQPMKKVYRLGFLSGGSAGSSSTIEAFRQGLRDLGYVEGKNVNIEYRYAEGKGDTRYPELLSDLIRLKVDVIVADGSGPSRAAKKATSTIPIVMTTSTDPIGQGLVASLARPGGNVTGLTSVSEELGGKLLDLTREIVPRLSRVAVVFPDGLAGRLFLKETEVPARRLGLNLIPLVVAGPNDYENVIRAATKERADALISRLGPSPSSADRKQFMALAAKRRLPVISQGSDDAEAGALFSYGRDQTAQYRRVAVFVDKILKGAKPAELPVEAPQKFELVINLRTAKQLNLTISQSVLYRADKVIK